MKINLFFITIFLFSTYVEAASFDCRKAKTFAENSICSDTLLSRLDDALAENYSSMRNSNFGNTKEWLKSEQVKWIKSLNLCKDKECLIDAYRKRVDETCEYGVVSGSHPDCTMSEQID
jgi:uncharacterized protein